MATNSACLGWTGVNHNYRCNPALFAFNEESNLSFQGMTKSDGASIDTGKKLIFEPITKEYLEELVNKNNLLTFTFDSNIDFSNKYFSLSYSPYYLISDLFIINPSFPEVAFFIASQKTLRLSSGFNLASYFNWNFLDLSFGGTLFYYDRSVAKQNVLLIEIARFSNNIVKFQDTKGIDLDLGGYLRLKDYIYLPYLSFQVKNLNTKYEIDKPKEQSVRYLEPFFLFERYSQAGIGYEIPTSFGEFRSELNLNYDGVFSSLYTDYMNISFQYSLKLISFIVVQSKNFQSYGFNFTSSIAQVGILYAKENQMPRALKRDTKEDSIYMLLEVFL